MVRVTPLALSADELNSSVVLHFHVGYNDELLDRKMKVQTPLQVARNCSWPLNKLAGS